MVWVGWASFVGFVGVLLGGVLLALVHGSREWHRGFDAAEGIYRPKLKELADRINKVVVDGREDGSADNR